MEIKLFGGVEAVADDGGPIDVGPAKCQIVLAALALTPGSAVAVPRLVELVWGSDPPRTAEKTLQSYITRLRKGLGAGLIVRSGAAYRIDVDPERVDVVRFQRLVEAGDVERALAEWTGEPLAGLEAGGLTATVNGLVEQWLRAVELDLERHVEVEPAAAIGRLTELTTDHPFREGLWALLMTALYRAGRQADALAAYRRARQQLVDGLGVEPGPRLRSVEAAILGQREELRPVTELARPPSIPSGTVTFGFCDVDQAARRAAVDPRRAHEIADQLDELATALADQHRGHAFAVDPDVIGIAFHRASDAAEWALAVRRALGDERWPSGTEAATGIGLHTGEAEERAGSFYGLAVNVAARLASIAHPGQVLVSSTSSALLDGVELVDLGRYRLDGLVPDQRIFQLGPGDHPALSTERHVRGNLPRRIGRLIGRDSDLDAVVEALGPSPVVTLVGPGGIGKTRLAVAAARVVERRFAGGAWLVELAGIGSSDDVPRAVADALDVQESPGRSLTASIASVLADRPTLLVLDNCEHVVEGAASLVEHLAEHSVESRVLATSREGLGLAGEQLIALAPLDPDTAGVELFAERAAAGDRLFDLDEVRGDVEEVCRRLDGVPLAIELAAARTRSLSPADLVVRLDDRLRLLTAGRRGGVERHRTLRATIQWSYDLLDTDEQLLFQRLSIFAGSFDLAATEKVAPAADLDPVDIDDLLGGLVERSMVIVESGPFGRRFRLLETMRQFGAEHLAASGQTDLVAGHHAAWCREQVIEIRQLLAGWGEIEGVARLGELWPNLRAAISWGCTTGDHQLVHSLIQPVAAEVYLRNQSEIGDWAERLLAITPRDEPELVAFGVTWAGRRYMRHQDRAGYERLVDRFGEPDAPMVRYARAFLEDDYRARAEWGPRVLAELRSRNDAYGADLFSVAGQGATLLSIGEFDAHDQLLGAAVDRFRAHGPPTCLSWALVLLGVSASLQGDHERSTTYFDECVALDVPERTASWHKLIEARSRFRQGHRVRAFAVLGAYFDELVEADDLYSARIASLEFVDLMARIDRLTEAARVLHHLEVTGLLEAPAYRASVADAARRIAAAGIQPGEEATGAELDDRDVVRFMRGVLAELVRDHEAALSR